MLEIVFGNILFPCFLQTYRKQKKLKNFLILALLVPVPKVQNWNIPKSVHKIGML